MAVISTPYGQSFKGLGLGRFNFTTDTLKILLTTAAYAPNIDTDEFRSNVSNEISGVGYVTGGQTLTGLAWTYDAANDRCQLAADPAVWTGATFTCRRGVIYKDTGTPATSPLLCWFDFGVDASPSNIAFTVTFSNGVYRLRTP